MANTSSIEWLGWPGMKPASWNFLRGCARIVRPGAMVTGCGDRTGGGCYAERDGGRWMGTDEKPGPYHGLIRLTGHGPRWTGKVRFIESALAAPLRTTKPTCWFVASVSDPFHEDAPDEWRDLGFAVMAIASEHIYIALTKREDVALRYLTTPGRPQLIARACHRLMERGAIPRRLHRRANDVVVALETGGLWPLPRLILGASVACQADVDHAVPQLLNCPAWLRAVSAEPLLEAIDLRRVRQSLPIDALTGGWSLPSDSPHRRKDHRQEPRIHWVIVGGESGPGARRFDIGWAHSLIAQCAAVGTACFVKQLGKNPVDWQASNVAGTAALTSAVAGVGFPLKLRSPKGGDMSEWPRELRVREFPRGLE